MNSLFRECLASIPEDTRAELEMSYAIAERIAEILKNRGLSQRDLAAMLGKRESEVSNTGTKVPKNNNNKGNNMISG